MLAHALSKEELSWVDTLNISALEAISPAEPSLTSPKSGTLQSSPSLTIASAPSTSSAPDSPTLETAPSPTMWKGLPLIPPSKEMKARERLVKNRHHAKVSRDRKKEYAQVMQARVAEIERENATLQAEVERELEDNRRLKEALALDVDDCVWA